MARRQLADGRAITMASLVLGKSKAMDVCKVTAALIASHHTLAQKRPDVSQAVIGTAVVGLRLLRLEKVGFASDR